MDCSSETKSLAEQQRRTCFRVQYPPTARPTLRVEGIDFKITEISEKGMRVIASRVDLGPINRKVEGKINFDNGTVQSVAGTVFNYYGKDAVILFSNRSAIH